MNVFETVKTDISVLNAAKRNGIRSNNHGMAKCPFLDDHHPSLKLNDHYFYCFGCGATGDVMTDPMFFSKTDCSDNERQAGRPGGRFLVVERRTVIIFKVCLFLAGRTYFRASPITTPGLPFMFLTVSE